MTGKWGRNSYFICCQRSFVGTMSTLYSLGDGAEDGRLIDKMKADKKADGTPLFTLATGVSILVFYAFAMQCISTIAIVYKETGSKNGHLFS